MVELDSDGRSFIDYIDEQEYERIKEMTKWDRGRRVIRTLLCPNAQEHYGAMIWNPAERGKGKVIRRHLRTKHECFRGFEDLVTKGVDVYVRG